MGLNALGRCARPMRFALIVLVATLVAACAQTKTFKPAGDFRRPDHAVRVLLMPPDVELAEITAGGSLEPNAAWTEQATRNVESSLRGQMAARNTRIEAYRPPADGVARFAEADRQTVKLHNAVGQTILIHNADPALALPTKEGRFDWTLGREAAALGEDYGADYALFVTMRDSFVSAGRVAVIAVAALFGLGIPGGQQVGFASLVDLRDGDIVWFNVMRSGGGDLRDPESARSAVESLLAEFPL